MPTVLVTGATSGIGLEFTKQYLNLGWRVFPTFRDHKKADSLWELSKSDSQLNPVYLDVSNQDSINRLAQLLRSEPIDLLINNAGIHGHAGQKLGDISYELFDEYLKTNAIGPLHMLETFLPNILASELKKVVAISSGAASNGWDKKVPDAYVYKASKAALNRLMNSAARDLKDKGVTILIFHPGLVITEKFEPHRETIMKNAFQPVFELNEAVKNMMDVISKARLEDSGKFIVNDGTPMSW